MKRVLFLLIVMLLVVDAAGTIPFVEQGKRWDCVRGYGKRFSFSYEISGDTLINDNPYAKVYIVDEGKFGDFSPRYFGALREDGSKVYLVENDSTEEYLLYDFDMTSETTLGIWFVRPYDNSRKRVVLWNDNIYTYRNYVMGDGDYVPTTLFQFVEGVGFTYDPMDVVNWGGDDFFLKTVSLRDGSVVYRGEDFELLRYTDMEYVPIVREGVQWVYFDENASQPVVTLEFKGETTRNGNTYKQLYQNDTDEPLALMREVDKKVYCLYDGFAGEQLLYDFNQPGAGCFESDNYEQMYIGVNGNLRNLYTDHNMTIIEGIGPDARFSILYDLYPELPTCAMGNFYLSHVVEDGKTVYTGLGYKDYCFYEGSGLVFRRCDLNGDGVVNVADVAMVYTAMLSGETATGNSDVNSDGSLNAGDISALYQVITETSGTR